MSKLTRLAYLLAQHPFRLHRKLVQRGLATQWIEDFKPFWDTVRPPGLPISDYASYTWLEYYFTARFRERYPEGDHFEDTDAQYARLLSYVKRREMHPLRMLKVAWALRGCETVMEFGAGAAPYAHLMDRIGSLTKKQYVYVWDVPSLLRDYTFFRFPKDRYGSPLTDTCVIDPDPGYTIYDGKWDGIVCTEVFEHLEDPSGTAGFMCESARIVCFDYVDDKTFRRRATLDTFKRNGTLTGPDKRGLYIWRRD